VDCALWTMHCPVIARSAKRDAAISTKHRNPAPLLSSRAERRSSLVICLP
jgi:hypothetical protein